MAPLIQSVLSTGYHLAKDYNRMWQPCRVAQQKVEQPTYQQGQYDKKPIRHLSFYRGCKDTNFFRNNIIFEQKCQISVLCLVIIVSDKQCYAAESQQEFQGDDKNVAHNELWIQIIIDYKLGDTLQIQLSVFHPDMPA